MQLDVWSDFVCPWCYLVSTSIEKLAASHQVAVRWRAYELRPKGSPPMPAEYRARIESMRPRLVAIAKEHYGIDIQQGLLGIDSRPALIGMKYAESVNKGAAYHWAVFHAYWQEAANIADLTLLASLAESVGLEREAFLSALKSPTFEAEVDADIQLARTYQMQGVPALLFEGKYYISGAQPYDELARIVEQLERKLGQNE